MQIVIDIDEDYYKMIKYDVDRGTDYLPCVLIANGTPLPKHHGRLIDADALTEKAPEIQEYLGVLAPTIIEARD